MLHNLCNFREKKSFCPQLLFPALFIKKNCKLGNCFASRHFKSKLPLLQTPGLCQLDTHKTWNLHMVLKMEKEAAPSRIFLKSPSPWRWIINSQQPEQLCTSHRMPWGRSGSSALQAAPAPPGPARELLQGKPGLWKRTFPAGMSSRQAQQDFSLVFS